MTKQKTNYILKVNACLIFIAYRVGYISPKFQIPALERPIYFFSMNFVCQNKSKRNFLLCPTGDPSHSMKKVVRIMGIYNDFMSLQNALKTKLIFTIIYKINAF